MQTYTPAQTQKAEKEIKKAFLEQSQGKCPQDYECVALRCLFYMPFSSNIPKGRRALWHEKKHHTKRPDLDNLIKLVCDGLNETAFKDDNIVCSISAEKLYSFEPRTEVILKYIKKDLTDT